MRSLVFVNEQSLEREVVDLELGKQPSRTLCSTLSLGCDSGHMAGRQ